MLQQNFADHWNLKRKGFVDATGNVDIIGMWDEQVDIS